MDNHSTSRQERKLVAILFADIQGYTAMMQSDEGMAMSRLKRYQKVLSEGVSNYRGDIIKNYGDGSLCLFSSVLDALNCAKSVQENLSQEPKVPLRIGLHLGDVTYSEGDVYGNDINIASRIESLGVAGCVLMSGDFFNKVKNRPSFEFQSLGKYHFKNVKEKIEVIALASEGFSIPVKSQMTGKVTASPPSHRRTLALVASLSLLFIAYWFLLRPGMFENSGENTLTEEQRAKRVTISIFENNTGLEELDNFGILISDWLTSVLRETGEAQVISQENLKLQLAGVGSPSGDRLLANRGIGVHIKGKIHFLDDQLVIMPSIINTETGEVIYTPSHIKGLPSDKEDLLAGLTQSILGYWKVRDKERYLQNPPRYEAYQEYLKAQEVSWQPAGELHYKKAYQLDTTFYTPMLELIPYYWNFRRLDAQDSLYTFLNSRKSNFTRWESLIYQFMRSRDDFNFLEAADLASEATKMDPSHYLSFQRAAVNFWRRNYPQRAIEILHSADTTLLSDEDVLKINSLTVTATLINHDYDKVIEMSETNMVTRKLHEWESENYVYALIYTQQFGKMHSHVESLDESPGADWLYGVCNALKVVGEDSLINKYTEELKTFARENQNSVEHFFLLAQAEMFSGNWAQAILLFEQYLSKAGVIFSGNLFIYGDLSYCYAQNGQMSKALEILNQIEYVFDRNYYKVRLLILENKYDEALDLLSEAIRQGHNFDIRSYKFDYKLKPLFDRPRFQEMVKAKE